MSLTLFGDTEQSLGDGAVVLRGFVLDDEQKIWADLQNIARQAPFRHMTTPGGYRMSVAMTNCGPLGWVSDETGYRYDARDPQTGTNWPDMPATFLELAENASRRAGFSAFVPDACLINRYEPGARLSLHQDRDEKDFDQPIVSVSLGLPATFQFGGMRRSDKLQNITLQHGDVAVWGGPSRLRYHGVRPLKSGVHPLTGACRINLTFRKAG